MTKEELKEGNKILAKFIGYDTNTEYYFHNSYDMVMPEFFAIQNRFNCEGSIIADEVEFYTTGYCMDTIVKCKRESNERMIETIFRACIKVIDLYESNPERFVSRK